jgi:uncharacterized protein
MIIEQSMKIHVNRIPEGGITEHATYDPAHLDMERDDVHVAPFDVEAFITKTDQELIVRAEIRSPVKFVCGRCLEEFPREIKASGMYSYHVQPTDVVDITEDVRQEIILNYPMVPLCRPECKGLCLECGQNLNHGSCEHQAES